MHIRTGAVGEVEAGEEHTHDIKRHEVASESHADELRAAALGVDLREDDERNLSRNITVLDQSGSITTQRIELHLSSVSVTLRELIRLRVQTEVDNFNHWKDTVDRLAQPTDTEITLNGHRARNRRTLDWQARYDAAIRDFGKNKLFIILDDRQIESLDEPLLLSENSTVRFLRIVPLVGG